MLNKEPSTPAVSIIIPAKNEERYLSVTLPEILRQVGDIDELCEVIVVDNESSDETKSVALRHGARVISVAGPIGKVRSSGIDESLGDIIVFIDADCIPERGWLSSGIEQVSRNTHSIVGCQTRRPEKSGWLVRYWALNQDEGDIVTSHLPGASLFFTREVVDKIGNFDGSLYSSEDLEFTLRAHRAGFKVYKSKSVIVYHLGWPDTVGDFIRRQRWHASSYAQTNRGLNDPILIATIVFMMCHFLNFFMVLCGLIALLVPAFLGIIGLVLFHALRRIHSSKESLSLALVSGAFLVSYLYFFGRSLGLLEVVWKRLKRCNLE